MRRAIPLFACLLCVLPLAGCATALEFRDSNAAVDADPLCASRPDQPNEPVAERCKRSSDAVIYRSDAQKIPAPDFRRSGEDDPR